jgi:hypothetical protein
MSVLFTSLFLPLGCGSVFIYIRILQNNLDPDPYSEAQNKTFKKKVKFFFNFKPSHIVTLFYFSGYVTFLYVSGSANPYY